jgi:1-deoxy-D-xylulose-5-phosphate reductoisomerase
MTAALNAANERANELFRKEKIHYLDIAKVVEGTMESHKKDWKATPSLDDIVQVDSWARKRVDEIASKIDFRVSA